MAKHSLRFGASILLPHELEKRETHIGTALVVAARLPHASGDRLLGDLGISDTGGGLATLDWLAISQGHAGPGECRASACPASALLLAQLEVQRLSDENRRKDEFLALLSHEMRTPLSSVGYAVGLLRSVTIEAAARQRLLTLIERQVLRMSLLVEEVLDVSRMNNGRLQLHRERMDIRAVLADAVETLESNTKERQQCLGMGIPGAPVWVMGDTRRLEQVFVNLIANASRYTDRGGELSVELHVEGDEAVVRVRDSGIGIAPGSLLQIFELFAQADAASPRSRKGLGIGLALVRQLVELHEGRVVATSDGLGRGSQFTVTLPIHPACSISVAGDAGGQHTPASDQNERFHAKPAASGSTASDSLARTSP